MGQELQENKHKNKDYFELVLSELDQAQDIITNYIIHHHGGPIRYQSAVGEGTTVTVSLPIQSDAQ